MIAGFMTLRGRRLAPGLHVAPPRRMLCVGAMARKWLTVCAARVRAPRVQALGSTALTLALVGGSAVLMTGINKVLSAASGTIFG